MRKKSNINERWPDESQSGYSEQTMEGVYIKSTFAMEPGAPYGSPNDAYTLEATLKSGISTYITLSSFEEMEEFSRHLSDYVERCRKEREEGIL